MQGSLSEIKVQDILIGEIEGGFESLLRQILHYFDAVVIPDDTQPEKTSTQEVVFEFLLDGMRYSLIRSYPQGRQLQVNLSPREKEIIRLIAKGLPNKTIAEVLEISPWTVATHLRRVFGKLGVASRAEMVAYSLREGLLENMS